MTSRQRPGSGVGRPGRESNPVLSLSHGEAAIQAPGATDDGTAKV